MRFAMVSYLFFDIIKKMFNYSCLRMLRRMMLYCMNGFTEIVMQVTMSLLNFVLQLYFLS